MYAELYDMPAHGSGDFTREYAPAIGGAIIIVCVLRNLFLPILYSVRGWF